jgi:hypothetical protein
VFVTTVVADVVIIIIIIQSKRIVKNTKHTNDKLSKNVIIIICFLSKLHKMKILKGKSHVLACTFHVENRVTDFERMWYWW